MNCNILLQATVLVTIFSTLCLDRSQLTAQISKEDSILNQYIDSLNLAVDDPALPNGIWVDKIQDHLSLHEVKDSVLLFDYLAFWAYGEFINENYREAIRIYKNTIPYSQYLPSGEDHRGCEMLHNLGSINHYLNNKAKALSYFRRSLDCLKQSNSATQDLVLSRTYTLAEGYFKNEYFEDAIVAYRDLLDQFPRLSIENLSLYLHSHGQLALSYQYLDQTEKVNKHVDTILQMKDELSPLPDELLLKVYIKLIRINIGQEKDDYMLELLEKYKEVADRHYGDQRKSTSYYYYQAGIRAKHYQYKEAKRYIDTAMNMLITVDSLGKVQLPKLSYRKFLNTYVTLKCEIELRLFRETGEEKYLDTSLQYLDYNYQIMDYARSTIIDPSERQSMIEFEYDLVEVALHVNYQAYKLGRISIEELWRVSEGWRFLYLRERMSLNALRQMEEAIDSTYLKREWAIQDSLNQLREIPYDKRTETVNLKINGLLDRLQSIQEKMSDQYPNLMSRRFKPQVPSIKEVQSKLGPEEVFVEFTPIPKFYYENPPILSIIISSDSVRAKLITSLDHKNVTSRFYRVHTQSPFSFSEKSIWKDSIYEALAAGYKIKAHLIDSLNLQQFSHFIFAPQGNLQYLPWAALPLEPPRKNQALTELFSIPFLIEKFQLQLTYTAKWWSKPPKTIKKKTRKLAVFPIPTQQERPGSFSESNWMSSNFNIFRGRKEQLDSILTNHHYDWLYFGCHAEYKQQDQSAFIYADPDDPISSYDILKWPMNQMRVILATCESQLGPQSGAEGLMGLTYHFALAGASAICGSLWEVPNFATEEIFNFSQSSNDNLGLHELVRQGQLNYLDTKKGIERAPYFWAGFGTYQSYSPPAESSKDQFLWILGGLFLVAAGGFILYKVA